jgi:uncharacterized protein YjdB
MNKNLLLVILSTLIGLTTYAQRTSMTIDNQTPGWLSSMIEYTDQQTLENLKVTGYINGTDIKFIRDLNINRTLTSLDLSEAHIVAGGEPYKGTTYYTEDDEITVYLFFDFNHMRKIILPLTTKEISASGYAFSNEGVDTLIVNGTFTDFNLYNTNNCKNVYLPNGISKFRGSLSSSVTTLALSNNLTFFVGDGGSNSTATIISHIKEPGVIQILKFDDGNTVIVDDKTNKVGWTGTIYIPKGTIEKYKASVFRNMTINEILDAENIDLNSKKLVLYNGDTEQLTATITPNETFDKSLSWRSSNEAIATVDANGNVTAVSVGKALITAETSNGLTATCEVTVYDHTTGVTMDETAEINIGEQLQLTANTLPLETSDGLVTWSSSNKDIATVTDGGLITGVNQGTCIVTATSVDGGFIATCQVKVLQPITAIQLDRHDATINVGNSIQIGAEILPANADNKEVVWTSSDKDVATVSKEGIIIGKNAGTATITVTAAENEDIKDECEVTVLQPVTGITLDRNELTFANIGETTQLTATVLPADASNKEVRWSSSKENVCTVSSNGTIIALDNGVSVVMATTVDGGFVAVCTVTVDTTTGISVTEFAAKDNIEAYYTINGLRLASPQKGVNIVKMKDGTTKKVVIK